MLNDYTLPVVVHIVHNGGTEQLSVAQVEQGIDHLNAAFANTSPYATTTGANTQIQFCLAQTDPAGSLTSGITYTQSALTASGATAAQIAELVQWNPDDYINVWVVQDLCSVTGGHCDEIAGYAFGPAWHGNSLDGIYVEAFYFGSSPQLSTLLAHEAGHYLGLKHTFDGGCVNDNCLTDGDYVCDTPPDNSTTLIPCDEEINSCNTDTNSGLSIDFNDQIWNYMDYSGSCRTGFTFGQAQRMHYMLENPRAVLLNSMACQPPCLSSLTAAFSAPTAVEVGNPVAFMNTSVNADTYAWKLNGEVQTNTTDWEYSFENPGAYTVELTAANNDVYCTQSYTQTVQVTCPVAVEIVWAETQPVFGDTVTFTAISNTTDFTWRVNGADYGNADNITVTFDQIGSYLLELAGSNGLCSNLASELVVLEETENCGVLPQTFSYGYSVQEKPHISDPDFNGEFYWGQTVGVGEYIFTLGKMQDSIDFNGILITKYDTLGQILAAKKFFTLSDSSIFDTPRLFSVGENIAVLSAGNPHDAINFTLIDSNLNIVFRRKIYTAEFSNYGEPYQVIKTNSGNYLTSVVEANKSRIAVILADTEGIVIAAKHIQFPQDILNIVWTSLSNVLFETDNGNFAIVTRKGMTLFNMESGIIWSKEYDLYPSVNDENDLRIQDAAYANGKTGIIGHNNEVGTFAEIIGLIDENGEPDWIKSHNYTLLSETSGSISEPSVFIEDSNMVTALLARQGGCSGCNNAITLRMNTKWDFDGNVLWNNASDDGTLKIFHEYNGSYFFSGSYGSLGSLRDRRIIRTDQNGYFPDCSPAESTVLTENIPFVVNDVAVELIDTILAPLPDPVIMTSNATVNQIDLCNLIRADAALNVLDSKTCSNGINVTVEICNSGLKTLYPLTNVNIYTEHPDSTTNDPLTKRFLNAFLSANQCDTLVYFIDSIPSTERLYLVVNDGAQMSIPTGSNDVSLPRDTAYIDQHECFYDNNIDSLTVPELTPLTLNLPPDTIICNAIDLTLTAPPGFDTYTWQGDTLGSSYTVTAPGTYVAAVTDNCGLIQSDSITIRQELNVALLDAGTDLALCTEGTVSLSVADFPSVLWSDGSDQSDITFTLPGTYTVTVTDHCGNLNSDTVTVNEIVTDFDLGADMTVCAADTVVLSLPADYSNIQWFPSALPCSDCPDFTVAPVEDMTVTVIAVDAAGCPVSDTLHLAVRNLESALTVTDPTCSDTDDGILTVVSPLAAGFSLDGFAFQDTEVFTDLAAGDYELTTLDSADCEYLSPFTVTAPPAFVIDPLADTTVCAGTIFSLSAPPAQAAYAWSPAAAFDCADCPETVYLGNYASAAQLTVTDSTGCTASDTFQIHLATFTPAFTVTDAACHATATGQLDLNNAAPLLTYSLDGVNFSDTPTFAGLSADDYTLYVRDSLGCIYESAFVVNEPAPLLLQVSADTTVTRGAEVILRAEVSGGTPPYRYEWQPTDFLDCSDCAETFALPPYSLDYLAQITDSLGCAIAAKVRLTVENEYNVFIPSSFTPNGDGVNDFFTVFGGANVERIVSLQIYARKGNLVFQAENLTPNDENTGWNGSFRGEPLNSGVYVYVATVRFSDGTERVRAGDVSLLR